MTITATPAGRTEQSMRALVLANHVRQAHATIKLRLRSMPPGEAVELAAAILRDPQGPERTLRVAALLRAVPRRGATHVAAMLRHAGLVGGTHRVGDLTARQRDVLADALMVPTGELRVRRGLPAEVVLDRGRVCSATAALRALRPDVTDPGEVVRLVLAHDDMEAA